MLTKESKIAVVGAGAIGGTTAAFIKRAGWDLEIVYKHKELADIINDQGAHITGIKGEHQIKFKAIEKTSDFSEPKDLIGFKYRKIKSSSLQFVVESSLKIERSFTF